MTYRAAYWVFLIFALPVFLPATTGCEFEPGTICTTCQEVESAPNSYMCSCDCGPEQLARSIRVEDPADDAEEVVGGATAGSIQLDSGDLDLFNGRILGVRFRNVDIPAGATITSARIQFGAQQDAGNGAVTMDIYGEAVDFSEVFTNTNLDLSNRTLTTETVSWPIPAWTSNQVGSAQLTPELAPILQEIIDQPGWGAGHAVSLLFYHDTGAGIRRAYSVESRADRAPLLVVEYDDPSSPLASQQLRVCMPPDQVPPDAETPPDLDALAADCSGRVQDTLIGIASTCQYPSACSCSVIALDPKYSESCDGDCTEVPLDTTEPACSNFDPVAGNTTATNAPGDTPVCLGNSPLAYGVFGQRTTCEIDYENSSVSLDIDGESAEPGARGVVNFLGFCPGSSCDVKMEYDLDLDNVTVGNFWGSATFTELASVGKTIEPAELSAAGDGTFAPDSTESSSRGRRDADQLALISTNGDVINVTALFDAAEPTCSVNGAVVGAANPEASRCEETSLYPLELCGTNEDCGEGSDDCAAGDCECLPIESADMYLALNLTGDIVNRPPTAVAADDTVECDIPGGARVDLDGSASSDLDGNLAFHSWLLGGRAGPLVGIDPVSRVEQGVGTQGYVLRVIDDLGQTDEDTNEVTVEDTTPPEIFCNANPTVTPPDFPISYTATATDVCDPDVVPEVVGYDCFQIGKKGKKIDKTSSCKVTFEGDTLTIIHSGGVDTIITWDLAVTDAGGNPTEVPCQVLTVKQP